MPFFHNFFIGNTLSKILNKGECLKFEIFYILAWSKILNIGECLKFEVFYFSAWLKFSLEMVIIKKVKNWKQLCRYMYMYVITTYCASHVQFSFYNHDNYRLVKDVLVEN